MENPKFSKVLDSEYFDAETILWSIQEEKAISQENLMIFKEYRNSREGPDKGIAWPGNCKESLKFSNVLDSEYVDAESF